LKRKMRSTQFCQSCSTSHHRPLRLRHRRTQQFRAIALVWASSTSQSTARPPGYRTRSPLCPVKSCHIPTLILFPPHHTHSSFPALAPPAPPPLTPVAAVVLPSANPPASAAASAPWQSACAARRGPAPSLFNPAVVAVLVQERKFIGLRRTRRRFITCRRHRERR